MDALFFYLIACLPLCVAGLFCVFSKRNILVEGGILTALGFIIAGIFHWYAISGMTSDVETWSGQVSCAKKYSAWQEAYDKEIYRTEYYTVRETRYKTEGTGKNARTVSYTETVTKSREVFDHLEAHTRWHNESYDANDTLGHNYTIDQGRYEDVVQKFGGINSVPGNRTNYGYHERHNRFIGGDANDYISVNKNNYVYPVTDTRSWENKVKACPSVFSYIKLTPEQESKTFVYPSNENRWTSDRLIGAGSWNITEWDKMNSRLGPVKKVNIIAVNFGAHTPTELAQWQESRWIGGKKNDLVICFGGGEVVNKPAWCHTFGWTEQEIVKRNIDTIILNNGINSDTLPLLEKEIAQNYTIKQWKKFDYLTVDIPASYFIWCFIIEIVLMLGWMMGLNILFETISKYRYR